MRAAVAAAFVVVAFLALLAVGAGSAEAGRIDIAKKQTKAKILAQGAKVIKNDCRSMGKRGKRGVKCNWFAARLVGGTTTRNCKGDSLLKKKGKKIKFKQRSCKTDKGATGLNELFPNKLLEGGYTPTYVFCFTTLGTGFDCEWEGLSFKPSVIEDCRGTGRSANKQITFKVTGCAANPKLTTSQSSVKAALAQSGLTPGLVSCLPGTPIVCDWVATEGSGGWTYSCTGKATAAGPQGPFKVDPCKLRAPELAPLTATGTDRTFGVNDGWPALAGQLNDYVSDFAPETARFVVSWNAAQPNQNDPISFPNGVVNTYNAMLAEGVKPILIIQSAPCWATSDPACQPNAAGFPPDIPAYLEEWREFAAAAAAQFDQALAIEVWNEANADLFYRGAPRPNDYASLLREAYLGIKTSLPAMTVLSTGTAAFAQNAAGQMRYDDFLRRVYQAGGKPYMDGIGHHAYPGGGPASDEDADVRAQIANLKDVMIDFGDQDKPIWITEYGVSTTGQKPYSGDEQASTVAGMYRLFRRIPGIAAALIHRWRDEQNPAPVFAAEAGFGLTRTNNTKKPVYCAISQIRVPGPC